MAEPDQLLDANNRKSRLSVMYTLAVAAQAGYLTAEPVPDFDSVDLTIKAGGSMRPSLDLQIKATSALEWNDGEASFPLRRKNYDDLRCRRQNPIVLMVMEMPVDEARWIEFGAEALTLRRVCLVAVAGGCAGDRGRQSNRSARREPAVRSRCLAAPDAAIEGALLVMMKNHDVQALRALHPNAIRAYLTARGWHHVEAYGDRGDVYDHGDAPEIVAPASSALGDYALRIAEIVDILASVEEREPGQILRDLSAAATDLIRVRAPEAEDDGSVSIEDGVTLVTQSRASCSWRRPVPQCGRARPTARAASARPTTTFATFASGRPNAAASS